MAHLDLAISVHSSLQKHSNTVSLPEHHLCTASSDHLTDVHFDSRLGFWLGHFKTFIFFWRSHAFVSLEGCFEVVLN